MNLRKTLSGWLKLKKVEYVPKVSMDAYSVYLWFSSAKDLLTGFIHLYVSSMNKLEVIKILFRRNEDTETIMGETKRFANSYKSPLLVAGFSIECLFKTAIAACSPDRIVKTMKGTRGHGLLDLYKIINKKWNLNFSPDTLRTIKKLQEFVIWKGRYPFPNKEKDLNLQFLLHPEDFTHIQEIWIAIVRKLKSEYMQVITIPKPTDFSENGNLEWERYFNHALLEEELDTFESSEGNFIKDLHDRLVSTFNYSK